LTSLIGAKVDILVSTYGRTGKDREWRDEFRKKLREKGVMPKSVPQYSKLSVQIIFYLTDLFSKDIDNMIKLVLDAIFIDEAYRKNEPYLINVDDNHVVSIVANKAEAEKEGIPIEICQ